MCFLVFLLANASVLEYNGKIIHVRFFLWVKNCRAKGTNRPKKRAKSAQGTKMRKEVTYPTLNVPCNRPYHIGAKSFQ